MKKTTLKHSESLTKRLAKYGALTAAIAGVADASGQIIYTDVDPDFASADANIGLDMNNDTNFDFVLIDSAAPAIGIGNYMSASGNGFLGSQPGAYVYPFALISGDTISSGQTTWFNGAGAGTLNYVSCYNGGGSSNWCGVTDKYLGLRFTVGADTFYGWARLDVSLSGDQFILKDYAYNSVAGEAIDAGQTLSVSELKIPKAYYINCVDRFVTISNIQGAANYKVISLSGQTVLTSSTRLENQTVDLNGLASGIYIVEVSNEESSKVNRKKIVLK